MLKPQDYVILIKLLANPGVDWSQRQLANDLCISLSEVNTGLKRLTEARLLRRDKQAHILPILSAAEELLIHSLKYLFPGRLGEYTRGIPTAVGASLFKNKIALADEPIPVWPDAYGTHKGVALNPIHPSIVKALHKVPDQNFYELLVLLDAIRYGRARERNVAIQLFKEKISHAD